MTKHSNASSVILGIMPAVGLAIAWQFAASNSEFVRFFFSSPIGVMEAFVAGVQSGKLLIDFGYTLLPTLIGFAIGVTLGTAVGSAILSSDRISLIAEWNVLVLGSVPIFAIAPMTLVWFGIGMEMKIALAVLSTFFVALAHAYRGGRAVPSELKAQFVVNGASKRDILTKLTLPISLDWVFASLRLNANFALLGVFVGEYMASERGLGRAMLQAGSLYQVSDVLACALAMIILTVAMDRAVSAIESYRHKIIQSFSVHSILRRRLSTNQGEVKWPL